MLLDVEGKVGGELELEVKGRFPLLFRIEEDDDGENEGVEVDVCAEVVDRDISIPIERGIAESRGLGCS